MPSRAGACSAGEGRLRRALAPHDSLPAYATRSEQPARAPTDDGETRTGYSLLVPVLGKSPK
ncbi:MAG TPA: hypothetical protein VM076_16255, partial [Gemmatimonadaceae bacterium]|nr:hypothetical protein [Gemmatimonadaceae bacterium]